MTTPYEREILSHFHLSPDPFARPDAPLFLPTVLRFVNYGLLIIRDDGAILPNRAVLDLYMAALDAVPLPVNEWTIPNYTKRGTFDGSGTESGQGSAGTGEAPLIDERGSGDDRLPFPRSSETSYAFTRSEFLAQAKRFLLSHSGMPINLSEERRDKWHEQLGLLVVFVDHLAGYPPI